MGVYVDGSFCQRTKQAGIGIHPHNISRNIKARTSLEAELQAVIIAVELKGVKTIYTDCIIIVEAIKKKRIITRHEQLCEHLYTLLLSHRDIKVKWVKREKNTKADALARQARKRGVI